MRCIHLCMDKEGEVKSKIGKRRKCRQFCVKESTGNNAQATRLAHRDLEMVRYGQCVSFSTLGES